MRCSPGWDRRRQRRGSGPQADASWTKELTDIVGDIDGAGSLGADLSDCIAAFRIVEAAYGR